MPRDFVVAAWESGSGMTISQPLGIDKHPSSCMNRLVGNTDPSPARRHTDSSTPQGPVNYYLKFNAKPPDSRKSRGSDTQ